MFYSRPTYLDVMTNVATDSDQVQCSSSITGGTVISTYLYEKTTVKHSIWNKGVYQKLLEFCRGG